MQDGATLSVVISGATLVGVIGVLARLWISTRAQKLEQPLQVTPSLCERQLRSNSADHENIFSRLSHNEQRISALEANVLHIDKRLEKMDDKLDIIINRQKGS